MRSLVAPLAIWAGLAGSAAAETVAPDATPPLRVAIVPGIAVNLDAARVDALSQDLAEALNAELIVEARGGLEVRRRLPVDGLPPDCVATPACIVDVARRLDVDQLLFVVMVDTGSGGAVQIDSTWVDPASGKSASRPALDIATVSEARPRFLAAARQLLPEAPVRPKPKGGLGFDGKMTPEIPRHFTTPAKITAAVTVIGIGVGIGFGLSARSSYRACDDDPPSCGDDRRDSIRTRALAADAGWLIAAAGAIATGILFGTSGKESVLRVEPAPSGSGVSFAAVGRF